jgi:hypothetical protein
MLIMANWNTIEKYEKKGMPQTLCLKMKKWRAILSNYEIQRGLLTDNEMLIYIFKIADNNQNKILACRIALQQKNTISTPTTAKKTSKTTIYLILQQFSESKQNRKNFERMFNAICSHYF